jgi:uncharacterized protein
MLEHLLTAYSPIALAFSGGLDSRFLAFAAKKFNIPIVLYLFYGPHMREREVRDAQEWAKAQGLDCTLLRFNPLDVPEVRENSRQRCYYCKRILFQTLRQVVAEQPPFPGQAPTVCDGSNASDSLAFRPGLLALREQFVHSPLAESDLDKESIRQLAALWEMDRPDQPSRPCMLTRFAYDMAPDADAMTALGKAEEDVETWLAANMKNSPVEYRLRLLPAEPGGPDGDAPLFPAYRAGVHIQCGEVAPQVREALERIVVAHGFARPEVIAAHRVSGYFDADITDCAAMLKKL